MLNPRAWGLGGGQLWPGFGPNGPAFDPATMAIISTAATVAGTAVSAVGTLAQGKAAQDAANYEAAQLQAKGKEELAASQREASQYERQKKLALSRLTARAAASGFEATDPSNLALADEIERYGTLQEKSALYGGEARRAGLEGQAAGRRFEGKAARQSSYYKAGATILGGISTLAGKYGPPPSLAGEESPFRYGGGPGGRVIAYEEDPYGFRTTTRRASFYS